MTAIVGALSARNARNGASLGDRVIVANGRLARMRGLLGRPEPERGEGLLIAPCSGIHTWFMRYEIDVAFLDRDGRIVKKREHLPPFRVLPKVRGARAALELPSGELDRADARLGDTILITEAEGLGR